MEDERGAELGPNGTKDEGSECSRDSYKSGDSSSRVGNQSALATIDEKITKLHNGEPEHVSSDEESVVEERNSMKTTVRSDDENENVEKESLESEEEDFKLHVDVDVSSDQEGSDQEDVVVADSDKRDQIDSGISEQVCGANQDLGVNVGVDEESEVIELSAGEDDDCEVVEIKEKEERSGRQTDSRQEEEVERKENNSSVEVVDIDDSAELDDLEVEDGVEVMVRGAVVKVDNAIPVVEDSVEIEEEAELGEGAELDDEDLEENDELRGNVEMEGKIVDHEATEMEEALEDILEKKGDKSENTGEHEESAKMDVNETDVSDTEEQRSEPNETVSCAEGEEGSPRRDIAEMVDSRTVAVCGSDEASWEGDISAELSDADDFIGFEPSEPHSFYKEFRQIDGPESKEGEIVGTLHISSDSHFFTLEGGEGSTAASGSEAGDSSRFSPVPTESSRCNSPSASSVSGERRSTRKRHSLDVTNPQYLKPFELGWKRELVYRSSLDSSHRRMADVYYYTPTNKKVRSAREVLEYVDGVELTIKNFLFTKEPMGLDCSKETIRDARKSINTREVLVPKEGKDEDEVLPLTPTKSPEKQKSPRLAEMAPTPVAPKSPISQAVISSPAVVLRKAATTPTPARSFPRIKVTPTRIQKEGAATGKVNVVKRTQPRPLLPKPREERADQDLEMGMLPPLWSGKAAAKKAAVSTTWSSTPKMVSEPLEKKTDPCSIHCPLKMGVIPTLQCRLCVCLYHPECVGLGSFTETIHSYVCKNCQLEIRDGKTSLVPPAKSPVPVSMAAPLLAPVASTTQSQPVGPRVPPPFRQADPGKVVTDSGKLVTVPRFMKTREVFAPQGGKQQGKKILGSVTTWLPSSASVQMPKAATTSCEPVSSSPPASMQSVAWMNGRKYIVVPKHNVLSVSPSPADKAPSQSQVVITSSPSSGERTVNMVPSGKEESMLLGSPPGVLLVPLLPPADKGSALQTQYLIVNAPPGGGLILPAAPPLPDMGKERGRKRASSLDEGPPTKQACTEDHVADRVHPMQNFVHDVCVVYNVFQHVFQYLKVQELLRAARVCRLWRDLAQHPSLWGTVHMKNSKVSDWHGLASTLSARRTLHLDLRKMLLPQRNDEVADMWQQFCLVIGRMDSLERLDLCRCPASVVQHVLTACPNLRTLNATAISCNSISLQDAGSLCNLEELRLKSLSGITLQTSLNVLSQLSSLKHLALTTFRNLGLQGVDVIGSLQNLELLELGEVNNLPASFPSESLAKLSKLRRLRLEKVQGLDMLTFNYLETARSLPQLTQLELVNFDVKPGFDTILASCSNIRKLLIIPTYVTQSATTNRMVLGGVLQLSASLQQFVWGVTHELLRVTELFVDQCDVDQLKKEQLKKGDCIPVLKPVPGIAAVHSPSDTWSCEEKYGGPTPSVEILSLPKLHKLLNLQLPNTKVKLLKIPFHATWRQYLSDMHT